METTNTRLATSNGANTIIVDRGLVSTGKKVHGQNPALLIPKIIRERILDSTYWKLTACRLNLLDLIDECAVNVQMVGTYCNVNKTRPTRFMCLLFRLIHVDPSHDIVEYMITGPYGFKYLKALFIVYARLVFGSVEVWDKLSDAYEDHRKLRSFDQATGNVSYVYFDQFLDRLLFSGRMFDMVFPTIVSRVVLEEQGLIEPRESIIMDEFDQMIDNEDDTYD